MSLQAHDPFASEATLSPSSSNYTPSPSPKVKLFGSIQVHPDSLFRLLITSTIILSSPKLRCIKTQVSAQKLHVTPSAGLILVSINALCPIASVLTAVFTSKVTRPYSWVINRRRWVNDCIKAWPIVRHPPPGLGWGGGPWSCPLFMRREIGFAIVSITRIRIDLFLSSRVALIFSHVSISEIISNAVIK